MEKIVIIIPAYNEEKRIGKTLEKYGSYFENLRKQKKLDYNILVVINNTKDDTEKIVKIYSKHDKNIAYLNFKQGGKGFAIIEGFKHALKDKKNSLVGFVDADLATNPDSYYDLIKNMKYFDGIIGSRYLPGAKVYPKQSIKRIIASRIFNTLIRILFFMPYRDTQCGAKIFKREAVEKIVHKIGTTKWAFDIDLLYSLKKEKFKVKEHPTIWSDNKYSKVEFARDGPKMILDAIKLRIKNSIFKNILNEK